MRERRVTGVALGKGYLYLFERQGDKERQTDSEREREISSLYWFILQMTATRFVYAKAKSHEPHPGLPHGAEAQALT